MTCTAEGCKHQVIDSIDECHVQAQDETDEAVGQKLDWSRKVDPHESPSAKLDVRSKMTTSALSLFRVTGSHFVSHTSDWGVCFVHEWNRQDGEDSAERSDNLDRVSFVLQIKTGCVLINIYLYPIVCTTKLKRLLSSRARQQSRDLLPSSNGTNDRT